MKKSSLWPSFFAAFIGVILILAFQNCGDVNLLSGPSLVVEQSPTTTVPIETFTPDTPYNPSRGQFLVFGGDSSGPMAFGAKGEVILRSLNGSGSSLYSMSGTKGGDRIGSGLTRVPDWDGDGIEDFAFASPYRHEHRTATECIEWLNRSTFGTCLDYTQELYREGVAPAAKPTIWVVGSSSKNIIKTWTASHWSPLGEDRLLPVGDLDGDGKSDLIVSSHFSEWYAVLLSQSSSVKYIQIPHGSSKGSHQLARDVDRDGIREFWHSSYDPSTDTYVFHLLNLKNKSVLARFSRPRAQAQARPRIAEESEDLNGDGVSDILVVEEHLDGQTSASMNFTHRARIYAINGKKLLDSRGAEVEILSEYALPSVSGSGLRLPLKLSAGDFLSASGIEIAISYGNKVLVIGGRTFEKLQEQDFGSVTQVIDKALVNEDSLDDLLIEVAQPLDPNVPRVSDPVVVRQVSPQLGFQQLSQSAILSGPRASLFLKSSSALNRTTVDLGLADQVPENQQCARQGSGHLIRPAGYNWGGHSWMSTTKSTSFFDPSFSWKGFVLGQREYLSLPMGGDFGSSSPGRVELIVWGQYGGDTGGQQGQTSEGFSTSVSECPGDFRPSIATPEVLRKEPTLSARCRSSFGGAEGNSVSFGLTSANTGVCYREPGRTYFFNMIQDAPIPTQLGGQLSGSTCPYSYCGYAW